VLIQYIYLLEISIKHNNYCRSYSLNIRTTCFSLNWPFSGPWELNNICVNYTMGFHLHCSVHNCFKTKDKNIRLMMC
jgi:hypothetical protein